MGNSGTIYAFDKDKKRLNTLVSLTTRAGCTNIKPIHSSFLDIDPQSETYSCVEYILLDPSCSGSGIIGRMDHLLEEVEDNSARLDALSLFQKQAILHAFSFPNVKRVVYSTCSKFKEENENVVEHVLETNKQFFLQKALPEWPHRGLGVHGDYLVRTEPYRDQCIGFFVALFERK
jgi:putative methyltransferase